jgi:hypothetical protein
LARAALTGSVTDLLLADLDRCADVAALKSGGIEDHCFEVAGSVLGLRFAGPALVGRLTRAVAHLRAPRGSAPDLSIQVWEVDSTQSLPHGPWFQPARTGGTLRGSLGDGTASFFQCDKGSLSVLDAVHHRAYHCVVAADRGPVKSPPLR